jgi:hypothetical protein
MLVCRKHAANGEEGLTDCCRGAAELRHEVAYKEGLVVYFPRMRLPTDFALQRDDASKNCTLKSCLSMAMAAVLGLSTVAVMISPASALVGSAGSSLSQQLRQDSAQDNQIIQVYVRRGGAARRTTVVGPRGGVASRTVVRRGAVVRPAYRPGRWVRPANYYWRPGGAIAAGAAIGFVTAATAAAWAGAPPGPGYCWYYTDPSRTQGFWDVCQ